MKEKFCEDCKWFYQKPFDEEVKNIKRSGRCCDPTKAIYNPAKNKMYSDMVVWWNTRCTNWEKL